MVSDEVLIGRLREFLATSDLSTTTNAIVRRRLEEDFGVDLSDRKAFIREQVDVYLQNQMENGHDNDGGTDNGGEEMVEEEEPSSSDGKSSSKTRSGEKEAKKRGGGFTKLCKLSPELQKFTGATELARTEVVKQMWKYIKEHNLQDPSNKRNIICDDTLRSLFSVESIDMFQMNKAMTKHIWPLDSNGVPSENSGSKEEHLKQEREADSGPKRKKLKKEREDQDERKRKKKRQAAGNSVLLCPLKLSDALVKFLGTGESALPRSDVIKRIWEYIKLNNLQDPSDKRQIICDVKLKELFDVDTFCGFTMAKLLTAHIIKTEK